MKTRIVRIGNSQGIRIPKPLLEQTGLHDEVEVSVQDDCADHPAGQEGPGRLGRRLPGDGPPRRRCPAR